MEKITEMTCCIYTSKSPVVMMGNVYRVRLSTVYCKIYIK